MAAKEELVVVDTCENAIDETRIQALGKELAVTHVVIGARITVANTAAFVGVLHQLSERLVVMTRSASDGQAASIIAAERRVPVLVIES